MDEAYKIWEDAAAEKSLVLTRDNNPEHAYIGNYLWFFYTKEKTLHIAPCFNEHPELIFHSNIKIWFKNETYCNYERHEPFPFHEEDGDIYEIIDPDWVSIEISFKVTALYGEEFVGPSENEIGFGDGMMVIVDGQKVFLDMETVVTPSLILSEIHRTSGDSWITLDEVDLGVFLEMLRVLSPPYKRVSRYYFTEFLLLTCRFQMTNLLNRLDEFSRTEEYDENWISKVSWHRMRQVLQKEPCYAVKILDNFRARRRERMIMRKVHIREPVVSDVFEIREKTSRLDKVIEYLASQKTRIIFLLLFFLFLENTILLAWFLCIYNKR